MCLHLASNNKYEERYWTQRYCLIPLLNWIRSEETKPQICFLVHIFHSSDDTTILVHRLSVDKRLCFTDPLSQEPTAVNCYRFRLKHFGRGNNCFSLQKFITNKSWDCASEYFAGGTVDRYKKEVAFGNFNPHSYVLRRPQHSIVKHRTARTKINAKNR